MAMKCRLKFLNKSFEEREFKFYERNFYKQTITSSWMKISSQEKWGGVWSPYTLNFIMGTQD